MRLVTLFSGVGMTEVGIKRALPDDDIELVKFCEFDRRVAAAFFRLHDEPETKNLGDITAVNIPALDLGDIDVLTSTFPCQSFSTAGTQLGFEHEQKGNLFEKTAQMIDKLKPKVVVLENVKGILAKKFDAMDIISQRLAGIGYRLQWQVINAVHHGLPQARLRWIALCLPIDKPLFKYPEARTNNNKVVADFIDDATVTTRKVSNDMIGPMRRLIASNPTVTRDPSKIIKLYDGCTSGEFRSGFTRHRIMSTQGVSPTLTTTNDTSFMEIGGLLTPKERWRLMGLSDAQFEKMRPLSDRAIDKIAGNGVCTNVIEDVFKSLRKQNFI